MFVGTQNISYAGYDYSENPETTGFGENFSAALDNERYVDSLRGYDVKLAEYERENISKAKELYGIDIKKPRPVVSSILAGNADPKAYEKQMRRYQQQLADLNGQYPEIQTQEQIKQRVQQEGAEIEREAGSVGERSTFMGSVGGFIGAMVGSLDPKTNPLNFATLPLGGGGKTFAMRVGSEAGVGIGVETINQVTGVSQNRQNLGLETTSSQMLTNILAAGAGAGVLRGGAEVAGKGVRKLYQKYGNKMEQVPASKLLDDFKGDGSTTDNSVEFALQREAMEEPITQNVSPAVAREIDVKLAEVESAFTQGRAIDDDIFPPISASAAKVEFDSIADTFDLDNVRADEYFNSIGGKAEQKFTAADIEQLTGRVAKTIREAFNEVRKISASANAKKPTKAQDLLIAEELHTKGYFPEKATPQEVTKADIESALKQEAEQGQTRFAQADVDDALSARNGMEARMNIRNPENITAQRQANIDYEASELAGLERQLNEMEMTGEKQSIQIERGDNVVENVLFSKLRKELNDETSLIKAMKVCAI